MTTGFNQTPVTLLSRLGESNHGNDWEKSWDEFVTLYLPAVHTNVRREFLRCGWHAVDHDTVNEAIFDVFIRFLRNQAQFRYDPARGKLRGYLAQIVGWAVRDKLRSSCRDVLAGSREIAEDHASEVIQAHEVLMQKEDDDYREASINYLMEEVRRSVSPQTFCIFDMTKRQNKPVEEVMEVLNVSRSTVDNANHRVMKKFQAVMDTSEYRNQFLP